MARSVEKLTSGFRTQLLASFLALRKLGQIQAVRKLARQSVAMTWLRLSGRRSS